MIDLTEGLREVAPFRKECAQNRALFLDVKKWLRFESKTRSHISRSYQEIDHQVLLAKY